MKPKFEDNIMEEIERPPTLHIKTNAHSKN